MAMKKIRKMKSMGNLFDEMKLLELEDELQVKKKRLQKAKA